MPSASKTSQATRLQNDFGADYWVRNPTEEHRVCSYSMELSDITY